MAYARMVAFHAPKAGSAEAEWEDGAGLDPGGGVARVVVADGATEAYDAVRWVGDLVDGFLRLAPELTPDGMDAWFGAMQQRWAAGAPAAFANIFEERKFHSQGSFATLLGCELDLVRLRWAAVAVGDTVLFVERGGRLACQFPAEVEFGINPAGVYTLPAARPRMLASVEYGGGRLATGDRLYLATDALADWLVRAAPWPALAGLEHPAAFRSLVARLRRAGELRNDDVTLVRVEIGAEPAGELVLCR